eukprot:COSAG06_NODE_828_length_12054_cov_67.028440_7_plen_42_part_00
MYWPEQVLVEDCSKIVLEIVALRENGLFVSAFPMFVPSLSW